MKYLKPIYKFLNEEALPLNIAKKYVAYGKDRPKGIVDKLNELFNNQQRVYIPIDETTKGQTQIKVEQFLSSINYSIKDYKLGIAFQTDNPKREIRIGKLLQKEKQPDLLKMFNEDTNRTLAKQQAEYSIVICQHPYDVTAMTTGRDWSSCLEVLGGANRHFIPDEIRSGTMTVYYIKSSDRNINNPIGRVNVKLYSESMDDYYQNSNTDFPSDWVWIPDTKVYGNFPTNALKLLYSWLSERQDYQFGYNYYKLEGLYNFSGTAWSVKLKKDYGDTFKVIELQDTPPSEDYYDDDDFEEEDYNDRERWVDELRDIDGLGYYASSYDYEEFEADARGINTCEVNFWDLVINIDSSSYYSFPDNFRVNLYDDLTINFNSCIDQRIFRIFDSLNMYDDGNVTIEGESFDSECQTRGLTSTLSSDIRTKIIEMLDYRKTLIMVDCDVKSISETIKEFLNYHKDPSNSPYLKLEYCDGFYKYLENIKTIDELKPHEIKFLMELKLNDRIEWDSDYEDLEIYNLIVDEYFDLLKIPNIFKYYDLEYNRIFIWNKYEDIFDFDNSTDIVKFKYTEIFDKLNLNELNIEGGNFNHKWKFDLSSLPKAKKLILSRLRLKDLVGLRPNIYENISLIDINIFTSPKGLSLKDPNKPKSFIMLDIPAHKDSDVSEIDFNFFDELMEVYPQYLEDLKHSYQKDPDGSSGFLIGGARYKYVKYIDIIKYLDKNDNDNWYASTLGRVDFLNKVIKNAKWKINDKDEVEVIAGSGSFGGVDMRNMNLTEIPVKFGSVYGDFYCSDNALTTLKNAPNYISEYCVFDCSRNNLTSLEFAPLDYGYFACVKNNLTSLVGLPLDCESTITCEDNNLTSLEGAPKRIKGTFSCAKNNLTSLEGTLEYVNGIFNCTDQKNGHKFTEEEVKGKFVDCRVYV